MQHFQFQPHYADARIPGWKFSFYSAKRLYTGIYHSDGKVSWTGDPPEDCTNLEKQVHDLMIFHVYDHQR